MSMVSLRHFAKECFICKTLLNAYSEDYHRVVDANSFPPVL